MLELNSCCLKLIFCNLLTTKCYTIVGKMGLNHELKCVHVIKLGVDIANGNNYVFYSHYKLYSPQSQGFFWQAARIVLRISKK